MERLISDSVLPFINQGQLGMEKVQLLINLKEFVDRVATRPYIGAGTVRSLVERFGVEPEVVSWGDYFQSELAFESVKYTVEELKKVTDTIKFDVMSAYQIFCDHGPDFFEWVEKCSSEIIMSGVNTYSEEEEEILHLKILKDYYLNMGIEDAFTPEEVLWYGGFEARSEANAS